MGWIMKRGEIYFADLNPTVGSEINKRRPVLIVSCDANNRAASTVTVLPITSTVERIFPFEVAIASSESGLPSRSKIQAQQIRTLSKQRIAGACCGTLRPEVLSRVDAAIKLHLALI
jgi:mRNA interferase MazF